jgi:glucose/arabinose dehydrogenase
VPKDNPFIEDENVLPETWSYGHRNPQGLSYDFKNKRLWLIEHGPRGGDELNLVEAGKNYGWPVISYGKEYWGPLSVGEATAKEGMEQPVKYYDPSIAPGSLLLYTGEAFPRWQGDLFAGALKLQHLNQIKLNDAGEAVGEVRLLTGLNERIRSLAQSPEGFIYLSTDSGKIIRLIPSN